MKSIYIPKIFFASLFLLMGQLSFAGPIPPQFLVEDFGVFNVGEEMILEWTISKDIDIDYFVIEKSNDDGNVFKEIGKIEVKKFSKGVLYIFSDDNLGKYNNYRIRIHLKNGMEQTSPVLKGIVRDID